MTIRTRSGRGSRISRRARRGFTLISMMVAMVLLVVGVSALGTANASTVKLQTMAQNRTNAIALARSYVEQVRTRDPWLVQSESPTRLNSDGVVSGSGAYTRSMTVHELRNNLIEVEVRLDFPRAAQPVTLTTLLFRGNGLSGAT
ncbi:prepilin-type N-terminal cleavage/methylation domain-containing protein [Gemmatimonas sp.]|uniref:type IV pilus modification PilV family protein n=1 Tax=Gemmatimonas sp. TaxID=1962908 RepID=UPI003340E3FA